MKANELAVGDWIMWNNKVAEVDTLWRGSHAAKVSLFDGERFQDVFLTDVKPIPITTEILEKNGFTKEAFVSSEHYYCNYNESHIRAFKFYGEDDVYVDTIEPHMPSVPLISHARFRYVHELQHALRLCKIDKDIKL